MSSIETYNDVCLEEIGNYNIEKAFLVTQSKIPRYSKVSCLISGGADSDIMLDLIYKSSKDNVDYVFCDTGIEYNATKEHLKYLEDTYNIQIKICKPIKSIPTCCKEYGVPFFSKYVSEMISRLQRHNFQWEDESFEILYKKYPKCKIALQWWCNSNSTGSRFNINANRYLKEFMIANKPPKISNKCCTYSKKLVADKFLKEGKYTLNCTGVRRAEGGIRATTYKNCFTPHDDKSYDDYRPIFWLTDDDKLQYKEFFNIKYSDCYEKYGLHRTGCVGCPYGSRFEEELEVVKQYEPKLYKAITNIFGEAYEYTRKYRQFKQEFNKQKHLKGDNI